MENHNFPPDNGPNSWGELCQRLDEFAEDYCRVKPSLAMVGSMCWVLGVDFNFRLEPRGDAQSTSGES